MTLVTKPTAHHRRVLNGLLDAFRMLGPVESLDWFREYFQDFAAEKAKHGHPAPWCDDLVRDICTLIVKYCRNVNCQAHPPCQCRTSPPETKT